MIYLKHLLLSFFDGSYQNGSLEAEWIIGALIFISEISINQNKIA
jgi:quinol-cytochrome oxidoreductase complex cytochrome b subunit